MLVGQGVSSVGDGMWFTIWVIYLTRVIGFPVVEVGIVTVVGGIAGIVLSYPCGMAADRFGARSTFVFLVAVRSVAMLAFCFVTDFVGLLVVAVCFMGTQSGAAGVRTSMVYRMFDEPDRLAVLAQTRVVQHIAYAVGAGLGAVILAADQFYYAALVLNAFTFAVLAVLSMALPRDTPPQAKPRARGALRDPSYVAVMLTTAIPALCWAMLSTGIPLWILSRTAAPGWLSAVIVLNSSVVIACLQVPVTARASSVRWSGRAAALAAVLLAVSCLLFASAAGFGTGLAVAVLVLAGLVNVAGELYFVAARWGLALGLMDGRHAGRYQGVAAATEALVMAVGPGIVAAAVTAPGISGWLVLAGVFTATAAATPPLVSWARRSRSTSDAVR